MLQIEDTHTLMLKIAGTEVMSFLAITRKEAGLDSWLLHNRFTYIVYGQGSFTEVTKQANEIFSELVKGLLMGETFKNHDSFVETYAKHVETLTNYEKNLTSS